MRHESFPTCTSTLLIVIFDRFADGVMDNKSHICLVNAHPKSHSGNNHLHKHKHYITGGQLQKQSTTTVALYVQPGSSWRTTADAPETCLKAPCWRGMAEQECFSSAGL